MGACPWVAEMLTMQLMNEECVRRRMMSRERIIYLVIVLMLDVLCLYLLPA